MKQNRNWIIAIVLAATAGVITLQSGSVSRPAVGTDLPTATLTDPPTATYEACGYMWAYHDDTSLTLQINDAVRALNPDASARAQLFGEDCVFVDGRSTFSAMQTDFYINLQVQNLAAEEEFGNWIKQAMAVIIGLPEDEIQGNKGFVEFSFIKNDLDQIILRVEIPEYLKIPAGLPGADLFGQFYTPPPPPQTRFPPTPTSTP